MTNTTITVTIENPHPSTCLVGATDFDAYVAIAHGRGVRFFSGQVTMAPDRINGGHLVPVGDSLDCWMSSEILDAYQATPESARRRVLDALRSGVAVTEIAEEL